MTATIRDLQNELTALQTERAAINLPELEAAFEVAKSAKAAYTPPTHSYAVDEHERGLSLALSQAENRRDDAKYRLRDLDREITPLATMLSAPKAASQARDDLAGLHAQATAAQATVDAAGATVETLRALLTDASAELSAHREHAASAILSAAKQGQTLTPGAPDRGQVLVLESALALGEAELDVARANLDAVIAQIGEAERELANATRAAAGLQFELTLRNFAEAVADYRQAVPSYDPEKSGLLQRVRVLEGQRGVERGTLHDGQRTDGRLETTTQGG